MAEKHVTLLCPACKKTQFESLDVELKGLMDADDTVRLRCTSCDTVYTKRELIDRNQSRVSRAVDELFQEELSNYKEIKTIHKAYLRRLLRHLEKMRKALQNKDYETTEKLLSELIEDTKADIKE